MTDRVSAVSSAKAAGRTGSKRPRSEGRGWGKDFKLNWILYLIFIPCAVYFIIFNYIPMLGVLMAFQDVDSTNISLSSGAIGSAGKTLRASSRRAWAAISGSPSATRR